MNNTFSWATFSSGLVLFMGTATEVISKHNEWNYFYSTPMGMLHGVFLGASFVAMIGGAISAQVPRSSDKNYGQRKEDIQQPPAQPEGTTRTVAIVTKPIDPETKQP